MIARQFIAVLVELSAVRHTGLLFLVLEEPTPHRMLVKILPNFIFNSLSVYHRIYSFTRFSVFLRFGYFCFVAFSSRPIASARQYSRAPIFSLASLLVLYTGNGKVCTPTVLICTYAPYLPAPIAHDRLCYLVYQHQLNLFVHLSFVFALLFCIHCITPYLLFSAIRMPSYSTLSPPLVCSYHYFHPVFTCHTFICLLHLLACSHGVSPHLLLVPFVQECVMRRAL